MNRRRDRPRKSARRNAPREPKKRILVVCEGKQTEPQYLRGFRDAFKNNLVEISEKPGVPKTLVEIASKSKKEAASKARRLGDQFLAYDEVWCVFDIDEHPNVLDALQMARDNEVRLAISNPCFELWLLRHFQDPPGMRPRNQVAHLLRKHLPAYEKSLRYSDFVEGYSNAEKRAERLDRTIANDRDRVETNPSTNVYMLTRVINGDDHPSR